MTNTWIEKAQNIGVLTTVKKKEHCKLLNIIKKTWILWGMNYEVLTTICYSRIEEKKNESWLRGLRIRTKLNQKNFSHPVKDREKWKEIVDVTTWGKIICYGKWRRSSISQAYLNDESVNELYFIYLIYRRLIEYR